MEDFAVTGEVILFQGGGCKSSFGVKETRELGDEGITLRRGGISQLNS